MQPVRYQEVKEILAEALDLPESKRGDYARDHCADDPELAKEVLALLEVADEVDESFLQNGAQVVQASIEHDFTGETLGPFEIRRKLGGGGMGNVYEALHSTLRRTVALKIIRDELRISDSHRARFSSEARALSSLHHPNICQVYDFLTVEGVDILVMEFIPGESLRSLITGGLDREAAVDIAVQVARALKVAHARGIVHRDLKPENVLVTEDGIAKVLDFGLARMEAGGENKRLDDEESLELYDSNLEDPDDPKAPLLSKDGKQLTLFVGTPGYLSPEQARGEALSTASDLYAFGLLLQELLTGQWPHPKGLSVEELAQRSRRALTLPPEGISKSWRRILAALLASTPEDRPSAGTFLFRVDQLRVQRRRFRTGLVAGLLSALLFVATVLHIVGLRSRVVSMEELATRTERARVSAQELLTHATQKLALGTAADSAEALELSQRLRDHGLNLQRLEFDVEAANQWRTALRLLSDVEPSHRVLKAQLEELLATSASEVSRP